MLVFRQLDRRQWFLGQISHWCVNVGGQCSSFCSCFPWLNFSPVNTEKCHELFFSYCDLNLSLLFPHRDRAQTRFQVKSMNLNDLLFQGNIPTGPWNRLNCKVTIKKFEWRSHCWAISISNITGRISLFSVLVYILAIIQFWLHKLAFEMF